MPNKTRARQDQNKISQDKTSQDKTRNAQQDKDEMRQRKGQTG